MFRSLFYVLLISISTVCRIAKAILLDNIYVGQVDIITYDSKEDCLGQNPIATYGDDDDVLQ